MWIPTPKPIIPTDAKAFLCLFTKLFWSEYQKGNSYQDKQKAEMYYEMAKDLDCDWVKDQIFGLPLNPPKVGDPENFVPDPMRGTYLSDPA